MQHASLSHATMEEVNLSGAYLEGVDLGWADLSGAVMSRADLGFADLTGANLTEADMWSVKMRGSQYPATDLRGTNLRGTGVYQATALSQFPDIVYSARTRWDQPGQPARARVRVSDLNLSPRPRLPRTPKSRPTTLFSRLMRLFNRDII
jgi:uncharacterized protein YjbI with pentapeptide repeats